MGQEIKGLDLFWVWFLPKFNSTQFGPAIQLCKMYESYFSIRINKVITFDLYVCRTFDLDMYRFFIVFLKTASNIVDSVKEKTI